MVNNRSTNQNRNHRQQPTEQLNSENHQNSNSNSNSLVRRQPVQKSLSSTLIQALYLKPTSITQRDSSNHNQTNKHHHYSPLRLICLLISPFNRIGLGYRASSIILILITFGIIDLLKNPQNSSIDPDCGPNRAGLIKTRSQLIRLRDRMRDEPFEILRGLEALPDFETELSQQSFDLAGRWLRSINGSQSISQRSNQLTATTTLTSQPDVTAVILNWNRPESVIVIVGHLCRYEFVESVIVWNNNPTRPLTGDDFRSTQCPNRKIRIYNSPTNQYFFARYLACLQSSTRFCFFQDDDCIVRSIRTMYYQFKSLQPDQALVVVQSDPTYSVMYSWEWCFKNQLENLNTCFAWLGHGSFVSKSAVSEFVNWIGDQSLSSDLIALSDNFFTTSLNREPSVIVQKEIVALSLNPNDGFSDGRLGLERNRIYIQKGVERLANQLSQGTQLRLGNTRPKKEALVEIKANEKFDRYFLLTNIESFDKENRPTFKKFDDDYGLNDWEDRLGNIGMKLGRLSNYKKSKRREDESNGWKGGREEWLRLEDEAVRFGQFAAMDGNNDTFWKPNSYIKDDYIGIGWIDEIHDPIELKILLTNSELVLKDSRLETLKSLDVGWQAVERSSSLNDAILEKNLIMKGGSYNNYNEWRCERVLDNGRKGNGDKTVDLGRELCKVLINEPNLGIRLKKVREENHNDGDEHENYKEGGSRGNTNKRIKIYEVWIE